MGRALPIYHDEFSSDLGDIVATQPYTGCALDCRWLGQPVCEWRYKGANGGREHERCSSIERMLRRFVISSNTLAGFVVERRAGDLG